MFPRFIIGSLRKYSQRLQLADASYGSYNLGQYIFSNKLFDFCKNFYTSMRAFCNKYFAEHYAKFEVLKYWI